MILPKTKTSALILPILTIAMSFFVTNTTYATGNTQDNIVKKSYLQGLGVCYELKNGGTEDDYKEGWWPFISNVTDDNYESMTPDQYQLAGEVTTSTYENDFSYKKLFPKEPAKNKIRLPNGWTPESGDSKTNCAHLVNGGDGFSDTIYDRFNKPEAKIQGSSSADDIKKFMERMGYKQESGSTENGRKCFTITYDWQKYEIIDIDSNWRQLSNEKGSEKSSEVCADIENGIVTKLSYPNDTMDARYLSLGVDYSSGGVTIDFVMAYDPENFDYNCNFMNGMNCYPFGSHLDDGGQEDLAYLSIYDKNYSWDQFYDELEKRVNALKGGIGNFSNAYNGDDFEYASGIFESFQKAQIGDGEQSPIHELSNQLTTNTITEHYGDNYDPEDNPTDIKKTEGSAMEAEGITSLYSGKAVNGNDESVKTFNIWGHLKKSMGAVGIAMDSFMACTYAKMAAATVNIIGDGLTVAACIASGGIGCIVSALGKGFLISEVAQFLVPAIVGFFLPKIANYYTRNLTEDLLGVDLGNAIASGGHAYMGKNGQYGGNSVANKDSLLAYMVENEKVIAENARYERETRSPFDTTSQYTFLGSIVNNLAPYQSNFSSLTGIISSIGDITTKSLSSIIPGASAAELANTVSENAKNTAENCPFLESIGGVGDAFCNPYFITDTTTLEEDPTEIIEELNNDNQFENSDQESEVPIIKDDSKLAKYIVYCGQRESTFGIADQNIAGQFDSSTGNSTADGLLGAVPFVGDTMDIFSNGKRVKNMGYITGEACVTGAKAPAGSEWPSWEETKKYQRFAEDQRLLENMGLIEKSSVTAYLEEYYEKHPLDNSYEGILARRSGLTDM